MKLKQLLPDEFRILFILLAFLLLISFLGQYSAFNGKFDVQVQKHIVRIIAGVIIMYSVYLVDFKFWNTCSYALYVIVLFLLIVVNLLGITKLGAQRWINLYFFTFQPSELMKLALILALSRYYSILSTIEINMVKTHVQPILMTVLPSFFIFKQPDFGTACLLLFTGLTIIFLSGFPWKIFITITIVSLILCPVSWFFLQNYQKNRILTFLDPNKDPLGMGYHILQSKIAIGSGYVFGKGFLQGSQSKLNFLPEKNTDFIFTTISEEFGFIGAILVILLFFALIFYFFYAASNVRNRFAKFMCYGLGILMFFHVFINISMVIGFLPVVGIPLPFLSYGGSSMITFMASCGLVMSALNIKYRNHQY